MTATLFDIDGTVEWIKDQFKRAKKQTAIVGMSGGIDSAVVGALCVKALGKENVIAVTLPCVSSEKSYVDAKLVIDKFDLIHKHVPLDSTYCSYTLTGNPSLQRDKVAEGNIKARLRMIALYDFAAIENGLVVGTTNKTEALIGYACYDEQTRALTPNGLKYFNELNIGDKVFSMNLETQKLEELPVQDMFISNSYDGNLLEAKTKRMDLLITLDHKLVVSKNHGKGPVCLVEANKRLKNAKSVCIPFPKGWDGKTDIENMIDTSIFLGDRKIACNSNKPIVFETNDFLYLMGLFIGDGCINSSKAKYKGSGLSSDFFQKTYRDSNTGRFVKTNLPKDSKEYINCRVHISSGKDKRSRAPLENILNKYNINFTETDSAVLFSNIAISEAFKSCGHRAQNKKIPRWVLDLPSNRLSFLFKGLMDSDGNANGSGYNTSSNKLAVQFVELCLKLGFTANISKRKAKTTIYKGKEIKGGATLYVGIASKRNNWTFGKNNTKLIPYKGVVWCPTVPPHGNLIVERNGKFIVCGNTKYGDHGVDIEPIQDFYKTEIFEIARLLDVPEEIINKKPTADLWNGQTDEEEIGLTYEKIDEILKVRNKEGYYSMDVTEEEEEKVWRMIYNSHHKRNVPPSYERVRILSREDLGL